METALETICNGLLLGTTGYAMSQVKPADHPFAFAACAVGFCHACAGIYTRFFDSSCSDDAETKCMNSAKKLTNGCMEFVALPLINFDLYNNSQQSNSLALCHGIYVVPLILQSTWKVFDSAGGEPAEGEVDGESGDPQQILENITILGNVMSLVYFAVNENNNPAGGMALAFVFSYSGALLIEQFLKGWEEKISLICYSIFFYLLPAAISGGGAAA